jgi:cell pole-organizing protein PopZ
MPAHQPSRQTRAKRIQKSTDKKRGRLQDQSPGDAPLLEARTHTIVYLTGPRASKPHPTTHQPQQQQTEEEDPTNLQELGMNLSGSQDKPTLALTIPRSNQVVYKGFPSATQFLSIQALRTRPASRPRRIQHPSHDPDTPEDASIVKSNHAADYISSIYPARLPA